MRNIVIGLGVVAAIAAGVRMHGNLVERVAADARKSERQLVQQAAEEKLAVATKRINALEASAKSTEEAHRNEREQIKLVAASDAAIAVSERDKLRVQLAAAIRGRRDPASQGAGTGSVADGVGPIADALGECSGRYEEVARVADSLSIQVTGLQQWVHTAAQVCPVDFGSMQGNDQEKAPGGPGLVD